MAKRRWVEIERSFGRRYIKLKAKKLQKKGYTYKITTHGSWYILHQGRKIKR